MTAHPDSPGLLEYLCSLDVPTLAALLHEQAERDPDLGERLRKRAAELDDAQSADPAEHGIEPVLDTLQRLLDAGTRADLAPLAKRAMDKIGDAFARGEDTAGQLRRAVALYARACVAHPPPPEALADWIISVAFDRPGWPVLDLRAFAKSLGDKGIARIKSFVDKVGDDDQRHAAVAARLREELAEISGDVDALVAILSAKLPSREVSLRIVRVLRDAGRHSEAIAHAAKALVRGKGPVVSAQVTEPAELPRPRPAPDTENPADLDELIETEKYDDAWEIAQRGSLADRLRVAEFREREHPADVLPVYREHVAELIAYGDAGHYRHAAKQLRKLRGLYRRAGIAQEFGEYLAGLLAEHRRKTRLIAEIRNARIALPKDWR
ncbi:hypothetical protein [Amycolatopsis albispora]|uniref:Uncharacterized protein n=1 Tax=Amycolatopsis albispora TaxID=1804986 RepID=A0A344LD03_9PSEU|nr:hypothetical protein [Amycolatopsis albispora]AXB45927.1 hypothetical protein A4R43_28450 [Amycolatopsis albispora]